MGEVLSHSSKNNPIEENIPSGANEKRKFNYGFKLIWM
jgi:hypothetical protein